MHFELACGNDIAIYLQLHFRSAAVKLFVTLEWNERHNFSVVS